MEFTFLCPDACFDVLKVAVLGFKLGVRGSLGPFRAFGVSGPVEALIYLKVRQTLCACSQAFWWLLGPFGGFLGPFLG